MPDLDELLERSLRHAGSEFTPSERPTDAFMKRYKRRRTWNTIAALAILIIAVGGVAIALRASARKLEPIKPKPTPSGSLAPDAVGLSHVDIAWPEQDRGVAISDRRVLITRDNGASWTLIGLLPSDVRSACESGGCAHRPGVFLAMYPFQAHGLDAGVETVTISTTACPAAKLCHAQTSRINYPKGFSADFFRSKVVAFLDPLHVYIQVTGTVDLGQSTKNEDLVYRSQDGGRSWRRIGVPEPHSQVIFVDDRIGFATRDDTTEFRFSTAHGPGEVAVRSNKDHALFVTRDGGSTWSKIVMPYPQASLPYIWYPRRVPILCPKADLELGFQGAVLTGVDSAVLLASEGCLGNSLAGGDKLWAYPLSADGTVGSPRALIPAGDPLARPGGPTDNDPLLLGVNSFVAVDSSAWLIALGDGRLAATQDQGRTWRVWKPRGFPGGWEATAFADPEHAWTNFVCIHICPRTNLYSTSDGGLTWTPIFLPADPLARNKTLPTGSAATSR